jgi:hypothetical protein
MPHYLIRLQLHLIQLQQMADAFQIYTQTLIADVASPTKIQQSQKIYTVTRIRKETVETIPNPKFEEWEDNFATMGMVYGCNPSTIPSATPSAAPSATPSTAPFAEKPQQTQPPYNMLFMQTIGKPPTRTIEKITITTSIESTPMNEAFKPFDTLYIKTEDHRRIKSSTQMFRDRQDLLRNLGLPNKYGLLLTGPPGTGKTSTIYAVATELQKPIWYVQLSKELTCGDLRRMFEHIYKIKGGGIVVFEDIDSMTDIVLARRDAHPTEQSSILTIANSEDVPLTLSYFLNFLDGALTQDGSIVIATTNHPERLDTAFKRPGRFDLTVELGNACHDQIRAIYRRMMDRDVAPEILSKIAENTHSPAAIIFHIKDYMLDSTATDEHILGPFMTDDSQ